MREKLKNLSFPVKCGLAILTFPLEGMLVAYLLFYGLGMNRPAGGWEMEPLLPIMLLYFVSLPVYLLFLFLAQRWTAISVTTLRAFFYKHFIFVVPGLSLVFWFILGYLTGRVASHFSSKTQKFILTFLVGAPTALFLSYFLIMVLFVILSNLRFWLLILAGIWLVVKWLKK